MILECSSGVDAEFSLIRGSWVSAAYICPSLGGLGACSPKNINFMISEIEIEYFTPFYAITCSVAFSEASNARLEQVSQCID